MFILLLVTMLVAVCVSAFVDIFPLDLASLIMVFVQTLIALMTLCNLEEDKAMKYSFMGGSGAYGVVHDCRDKTVIECRVGSNPTRSTIRRSF